MIWATRTFEACEWGDTHAMFQWRYDAMGAPAGMMMLSTFVNLQRQLYIAIPDDKLLRDFAGFVPIPPEQVPAEARLLIGNPSDVEKPLASSRTEKGQPETQPERA
jgi:hypothetical protein